MFGFYTTDGGHSFILSVVFLGAPAPVIWSANPDNPVTRNAILNFTSEGDLLLHEADGAIIWTTDTNSLSVAGMRLDDLGNLVLFDQNNTTVWQSLDHPTDTLVLGQSLCRGNNLSAKTSSTKWPGSRVYLSAELDGLQYSFKPAAYTQLFQATTTSTNATQTCYAFVNGSFGFPYKIFSIPLAGSVQLMRLESDGHLRVYEMGISYPDGFDVLSNFMNFCDYPLACGDFGVCSNGQCSCPSSNYFRLQNERHPDAGCIPLASISCDDMHDHKLIPLNNVSYFSYTTFQSLATESALKVSGCILAILLIGLLLQSSSFQSSSYGEDAGFPLHQFLFMLSYGKMQERRGTLFDGIPGIPKRFSFHELKAATSNFSMKLGAGGFGSVFKGTIGKETIAVKRLEGVNQGMEEFLAEVKTIGRIHQLNLVRLVGFCAEKSHRLLVYEYLSNGSLDNWIFHTSLVFTLSWKTRRNVMLAIARGLSYLHEECEEKIAHLHIKPQNILLDNKFNAKLSDFGLSKMINRDQSKHLSGWDQQSLKKADIYSFGIVMIEKICGRQNLDESQPEQSIHLISLLQEKAKSGQLFDLVDSSSDDMKSNVEEIMQTMKLALWCLQVDSSRRPLMSTVAKVLEGAVSMEATPDCIFVPSFASINTDVAGSISSYVSSESQLSGPR
ncbi:unnamed protein product [Miscanthus lutarioriparius]|uniref:non-specific serine/threonine protein kinase n=1 Tax=Miscanthus lutarioriparius TaxID=422564 RepID=A0A811QGX6_9POAL|nr:unnamed protein product [Miscanthus lutarioriparius]